MLSDIDEDPQRMLPDRIRKQNQPHCGATGECLAMHFTDLGLLLGDRSPKDKIFLRIRELVHLGGRPVRCGKSWCPPNFYLKTAVVLSYVFQRAARHELYDIDKHAAGTKCSL